jgi:hypothetical protein
MGRPLGSLNRRGRNDRKGKVSDLKKTLLHKGSLSAEERRLAKELGFNYKAYPNSVAGKQQLNMRINSLIPGISTRGKKDAVKNVTIKKDKNKLTR